MLILTRKLNESIVIGNDIEVKIVKIQGNQVHIGIDAPKSISVYRHELYEQVMQENQNAVQHQINKDSLSNLSASISKFKNLLEGDTPTN